MSVRNSPTGRLATHPRPLRGFALLCSSTSLSAFLQHFSRPALSVTIARLSVARRKPTCPVGATSKWQFRGARMSGRLWPMGSRSLLNSATLTVCGLLSLVCLAASAQAQERREREPNSVYAERRAKLASQVDGPIVLWGYTGREEVSQTYVFEQEENFYYLTGHNEEGAGLLILPPTKVGGPASGPRETLFLPAKNPQKEKWNGVRMSPNPHLRRMELSHWQFREDPMAAMVVEGAAGGGEGAEASAPIVSHSPTPTVLHSQKHTTKIEAGDIVVQPEDHTPKLRPPD